MILRSFLMILFHLDIIYNLCWPWSCGFFNCKFEDFEKSERRILFVFFCISSWLLTHNQLLVENDMKSVPKIMYLHHLCFTSISFIYLYIFLRYWVNVNKYWLNNDDLYNLSYMFYSYFFVFSIFFFSSIILVFAPFSVQDLKNIHIFNHAYKEKFMYVCMYSSHNHCCQKMKIKKKKKTYVHLKCNEFVQSLSA